MEIEEIEEVHYDFLNCIELIDILEEKILLMPDGRKRKERKDHQEECNKLITLINQRSGIAMYSKFK